MRQEEEDNPRFLPAPTNHKRETQGGGLRFHGDITFGNVLTVLVLVLTLFMSVRKNDLSHFEEALKANQRTSEQAQAVMSGVMNRLEEMHRVQIEDHIRLEMLESNDKLYHRNQRGNR